MNILIDIAHPAHVHLTKNVYSLLTDKRYQIIVTTKGIPSVISLLELYRIPYIDIGKKNDNLLGKTFGQLKNNFQLMRIYKKYKINLAFGSTLTIAQLTKLGKVPSIILDDDDDEVEPLFVKYAHPATGTVLSPDCVVRKSPKAIKYAGYHELAYLHPNRFQPDPDVLKIAGLLPDEPYFILRFNAFKAHHDVGAQGLSIENKHKLIALLEKKGKVFITTERNIEEEFKKYQLQISPDKIHSFIYFATMLIGDSQTMTSEAAVLGTPGIKLNSFAGRLSVPKELENKYKLCYSFSPPDFDMMMNKIEELLNTPNLKEEWQQRRRRMLQDKIDVTAFFVWFIENYPESAKIMKENPDYQYSNNHNDVRDATQSTSFKTLSFNEP